MRAQPSLQRSLVVSAIALILATVFLADLMTHLGIAVWVFYIFAVGLSLFQSHKQLPLQVAALVSVLIVIGYFLSPPGMRHDIVQLNRGLGLLAMWGTGGVVHLVIDSRERLRRLNWLQEGRTLLAQSMIGEQTAANLAASVLRALNAYVGGQVGLMYMLEGKTLRRAAAWSLPADDAVPASVALGQGLTGQAAAEGRMLRLDPLPDHYLAIGSTLGSTPPAAVLIAPLKAEGKVCGVLELGFLHKHAALDDVCELLEDAAEDIGISLRSARYREQLQALLEETQAQSEELQVQGDNLRAMNEELEEQSHNLQHSQAQLEAQQNELEQANAELEEKTHLLERQRSELLIAQGALLRNAEALQRANEYKSEFLANMSHELRTPLNSSMILARLLSGNSGGNLTAEQVKWSKMILSANNDLLALINDILDLAKVEAGRLDLTIEPVSLAQVIEPLRQTFQPIAGDKSLAFEIEVVADVAPALVTDLQRLQQILRNLLSNAFKFTERGSVRMLVRPAHAQHIAFCVQDTGPGIEKDQQAIIFEAFRQANGSTNRRYGGTGLGLSISRELAKLLGGQIEVDSTPGLGSTFVLTIPVATPRRAEASQPLPPTHEAAVRSREKPAAALRAANAQTAPLDDRAHRSDNRRMILVVEDDDNFARLLYDLAHEMDFDCAIAGTAAEGLSLAHELRPDAILLDVGLPDVPGLSVLEQLKRNPDTRHIPVHIVSVSDHTQVALELGAVGYALKPVAREHLADAMRKLEDRLRQKARRLLIVEADVAQRLAIVDLLGSEGVEVNAVSDIAEALSLLGSKTFDCAVVDIDLPDGSSYELLRRIAESGRYAFPPVIAYAGRALTADEEKRLRAYSRSVVIKGAKSPERLLDEVTLFLHQVESELPPEKQNMLRLARERDAVFEGRRILLAEDDARNAFALSNLFESLGAMVIVARNGREALDQLAAEPSIDLVLMDVMMPEMDGLAAMRAIRKNEATRRLPVIALTARAMIEDRRQCLEAGASDYLAKPIDVDKITSLCRVWMPK